MKEVSVTTENEMMLWKLVRATPLVFGNPNVRDGPATKLLRDPIRLIDTSQHDTPSLVTMYVKKLWKRSCRSFVAGPSCKEGFPGFPWRAGGCNECFISGRKRRLAKGLSSVFPSNDEQATSRTGGDIVQDFAPRQENETKRAELAPCRPQQHRATTPSEAQARGSRARASRQPPSLYVAC